MLSNIYPLSYCVPDELIVSNIPEKKQIWADVIPGFPETCRFGKYQEKE